MSKDRKIETEIEIEAPAEAVWKALTDAAELMRWFPLDARVEPRQGGMIWFSWGPPYEGENVIEIWDPPRRLKLADASISGHHTDHAATASGAAPEDRSTRRVAMDYTLESAGGRTILRLVHSGFGEGADWDEEFNATRRGWMHEFLGLKHYMEHHRGEDRRCVWARLKVEVSREEAWRRLMSEQGLNLRGVAEGDSFDRTTSTGDRLRGRVLINRSPEDLCVVLDNLKGAFFRITNEAWSKPKPHVEPNLWLSTYGLFNYQVVSLQENLTKILMRLFADVQLTV